MTDDQHGQGAQGASGAPQGGGRWDPLPQGEYDDGATAFVKLPEGGIDALLAGDSPLAAPGHGYVPPQITVAPATTAGTDPAATGTWSLPVTPPDGAEDSGRGAHAAHGGGGTGEHGEPQIGTPWPDPNAGAPQTGAEDRFTYHPGATGQWTFEEPAASGPAPGHDVTGQWSIPVAGGDLPDESGEYTTAALAQQWGAAPPTLPGGAPAPWATPDDQAGPADGAQPAPGATWQPPYAGGAHGTPEPEGAPRTPEATDGADAADGHESAAQADAGAHQGDPAEHPEEAAQAPADQLEEPATDPAAAEPDGVDGAVSEAAVPETAVHETAVSEPATGEPAAPDAVAAAAGPEESAEPSAPGAGSPNEEHPLVSYVLRVNGAERPVPDAWIGESLLYVLRERLGLAGAKDGCSQGECGACNVQVDGRLVASCLVPAVTAAGSEVRTVEGLAVDGQPSDVQRALARCGAVQCGFCVPGMAMTVHDLLEGNPAPTELETRQALCGNLCRCSGYRGVLEAVKEVVAEREANAAADAETDGDEARIPHQAGPGAGGIHPSVFEAPGAMGPAPHGQAHGEDGGGQAYGDGDGQSYGGGQAYGDGDGQAYGDGGGQAYGDGDGQTYGGGQAYDTGTHAYGDGNAAYDHGSAPYGHGQGQEQDGGQA
ncbi:2Fe-2S iron-sulfur cluster-binding protein [Streptomyces griseosporeus]|uniref:2Fe-2S iron-sulfur cluster-binding protein n=1 Tax=Streptomyces griseosporeus TaxID=1910 RepID=UPI0036FE7C14